MTLNELFAIQEADVTEEFLLKAGWSEIAEEPAEIFRRSRLVPEGWNHIRNTKVKREI